MAVMDAINQEFGRDTLHSAAEGVAKRWAMRAGVRSPLHDTMGRIACRLMNCAIFSRRTGAVLKTAPQSRHHHHELCQGDDVFDDRLTEEHSDFRAD